MLEEDVLHLVVVLFGVLSTAQHIRGISEEPTGWVAMIRDAAGGFLWENPING